MGRPEARPKEGPVIVDTHVHVISDDLETYPLVPGRQRLGWVDEARFTVEQVLALMDEAGVDRTLLVQPNTAYGYDNRYTALSARRFPERFVSVPIVDMEADGAADTLRTLNEDEGMTGVRLFARAGSGEWLDNPKTDPVWELAQELGFPISVLLGIKRTPMLAAMLERFPGVTVALDHLGSVTFEDGPPYETAAPIFDLARFPNLRLKFSPTNELTASRGPGDIKDVLKRFVDRFGVDRLMWGSNFSATYEPPYAQLVEMGRESLSFLTPGERAKIMGGNALEVWPALRANRA